MTAGFRSCFGRWRGLAAAIVLAVLCGVPPAGAKTLQVGPDRELKQPSDAAAAAQDGDTIEIDPVKDGYFDCAILKASHLTVVGKGEDVVLTDKTCQGKGIFVTTGSDITIRNLTLTRARVPDHNGAGIRAEGKNLTVEHVRFINNENGILAADSPDSAIRISDSEFARNGKCEPSCAHGVYVNHIALLRIERSKFFDNRVGHHIKSRASRTELVGNDIEDGPEGTASYLVDISNGGGVLIEGNTMEKGPKCSNHSAAVVIGAEGVTQRTPEIIVRRNKFTNDQTIETIFVRNMTATEAALEGNTIIGKVVALAGDGAVR
jgi:nitrous oxidase accessory protein NosD